MTRGRRPAGICGAALLLAGRMNNFRRSIGEIVQVVKIADSTVRKRLEEFRRSPSEGLTVEDFRKVWLEEEMDSPAFTKGREREEREKLALEEREGEGEGEEGLVEGWGEEEEEATRAKRANTKGKGKAKQKSAKKRKRKRQWGEDSDTGEEDEDEDQLEESEYQPKKA
ncbi:hypothetical protein AX16_006265 [Volvariella volvacea WC 439]|nr:hypothetical protein AX16_006265 [Volvariella volvacea WC 439]